MMTLIKRKRPLSLLKSLTESVVEGWLGSELTDTETRTQAGHTAWITSVLNPPAPPTVNKALPW